MLQAAGEVLRSGRLVLGPHTEALEAAVAAMAGTRHAVAVGSGAAALEIIFRDLNVAGRIVLVPTNTNYATAAAALAAGARVRLYDAGLYPSNEDLSRRLCGDVAAVVVVHIGGYVSPGLDDIATRCREAGVPIIEDAAHAHGSALGSRPAGGLGYAAAFSFFATKVVTTGEGGAVTTDDPGLAARARKYRNQGKDDSDQHTLVGSSWRMSEIGAALGCAQLAHLARDVARRRAVIDRYSVALDGHGLTFPAIYGQVSGHKAVALLDCSIDREQFYDSAAAAVVTLGRGVYTRPLHTQPVFADLCDQPFPVADEFAARHICLPLWRDISDATVAEVIDVVGAILRGRPQCPIS
ncbi:DegT/DnrJ/EryC1/StrS family aminotransferase [Nocardia sp. NPDC057227]|uniref:DegT/DnrJ/EryC1/StrS family aminotransferase n=1 Tax=Nocardia sp. NPDC057227 TaxID=3346056 RepID=UPI00363E2116